MAESQSLEDLQTSWKTMFQSTLPTAATSKSTSQPKWPVHVDHCFARIILDNIVGIDTPWMQKIKAPAYKNMSREQLINSIELGEGILSGTADLVQLDDKSLQLRGKIKRGSAAKRKLDVLAPVSKAEPASKKRKGSPPAPSSPESKTKGVKSPSNKSETENEAPQLKRIALSHKTPFQKKVLTALCQVPRGQYTTYGAIAAHLSTSARAVGNALRNNPFAPEVPCHRVLATGGGLGGFGGSWGRKGEEGLNDEKKRRLLREEGVRFDGKGRVVGGTWEGFV